MDLVKTLLVYMTVLVTSSTMLSPALTPMPADYATHTPPPVTASPYIPPATAALTPAPTATATPAMTTVYVGDRGENVRKLQTRLKELGYLTDKVDGIFGKNTLRAVERFQEYNNLKVDGIAGSQTLNKLYNDRNVVWAPVDVTRPPVTTAPPVVTATVPVYYMATTGERLYTDVVTLQTGRTTIRANHDRVPGYGITSASQVTVTVASNGTPNPASVTFIYQKLTTNPPVTGQVVINYLDGGDNNRQIAQETRTLPQGTTAVSANDSLVPAGYTLTSVRTANVTVGANGVANPSMVSFVYKETAVSVMVPINYEDTDGKLLASDQMNLSTGTHEIIANNGFVEPGYTLQGANKQTVTVDDKGNATPPVVTFVYKAPVPADVPVYYKDTEDKVLHEETQRLMMGTHEIIANQALVGPGYELQGLGTYTVLVDEKGVASPASVTFIYKAPAPATETPAPATETPAPATETPAPATETPAPATETPAPATETLAPATETPAPATETPAPATETPAPATETPAPATETPAPTETPTPTPQVPVPDLPEYQSLRFKEGSYPVYTGPGSNYYRVGKATVGGGVCRLYGIEGDWLLMGYGTSDGGYRIGYITKDALPGDITAPPLTFSTNQVKLNKEAKMIDDPIINAVQIGRLPKGSTVTVLAYLQDGNNWAYIEVSNFENNKPARGFINRNNFE
ncbi:MAG: hypothetical protein GX611_08290 [Clostridiales bacterium]|nr:hypothetical protein [Clostridiales bacterium]